MALNRSTKKALTVYKREEVKKSRPNNRFIIGRQREQLTYVLHMLAVVHINWPCPRDGRSSFRFICATPQQKQNNNINLQIKCVYAFTPLIQSALLKVLNQRKQLPLEGQLLLTQLFFLQQTQVFPSFVSFLSLSLCCFSSLYIYFTLSAANINSWDDWIETHSMCAQLISDRRLGLNTLCAFLRVVFTL